MLLEEFMQDELVDEFIAQLFGLHMTGPLADYHQQFEVICNCIPEGLFLARLKMLAFKTELCLVTAIALKAGNPLKSYQKLVVCCQLLDDAFSYKTTRSISPISISDRVAALPNNTRNCCTQALPKQPVKPNTNMTSFSPHWSLQWKPQH